MPRPIPNERLPRLIEVATEVFTAQGYRRTQIEDVARALGVAARRARPAPRRCHGALASRATSTAKPHRRAGSSAAFSAPFGHSSIVP
jgi:hypothetical protein